MVSVMLNSIMSVVNAALVPRQLQAAGLTQSEAAQAFGEVTGMVAPMLYFPMMAIGPIIQVVTPAVAERMGAKQYGRVADLLRKAFFIAGAVGAVFSAVLFLVPGLIGRVLYGAPHIAPLVRPLSVAAPFVYLGMVCSGVLHGLGQMAPVTANVFAGNVARCVLICTLVSRPGWGRPWQVGDGRGSCGNCGLTLLVWDGSWRLSWGWGFHGKEEVGIFLHREEHLP